MPKLKKSFLPIFLLSAAISFLSCQKKAAEEQTPSRFDPSQLSSRFPNDLGPATVDVSSYPKEIQTKYRTFLAVCTSCHTSARPLNAPFVTAQDWKRYIQRMHLKMNDRKLELDSSQAKQIVEFLVYDSKIRKIDHKADFDRQQADLKKLFDEVTKEKERLTLEETKRLPKKEYPYVGVK